MVPVSETQNNSIQGLVNILHIAIYTANTIADDLATQAWKFFVGSSGFRIVIFLKSSDVTKKSNVCPTCYSIPLFDFSKHIVDNFRDASD